MDIKADPRGYRLRYSHVVLRIFGLLMNIFSVLYMTRGEKERREEGKESEYWDISFQHSHEDQAGSRTLQCDCAGISFTLYPVYCKL